MDERSWRTRKQRSSTRNSQRSRACSLGAESPGYVPRTNGVDDSPNLLRIVVKTRDENKRIFEKKLYASRVSRCYFFDAIDVNPYIKQDLLL